MSDSAAITVLMSVYNGRPYLEEAIKSIVNQTFSEFEFLIIDDASTDGSRELLKEWDAKDERIRLILHDKNRGLGYALAEGVEAACGKWIVRMDDDDISLPHRIETQVAYLEEHPEVDILGAWAVDINAEGKQAGERKYPTNHEEIEQVIWTNPIIHPTAVLRKSAIERVGSYDPAVRKRQDYDLWFRCLEGGLRFANVPEVLLEYRITDDHYQRNDVQVAWEQAKMGWAGCWRIGASPVSYIGVGVPLLRAMLPQRANKFLHRQLHRIDPRRKEAAAH